MYSCMSGRVVVGVPRCDAGPGPDAIEVVRSCAEAAGRPSGTACDFAESCMTDCRVAYPTCMGGVLTIVSSECPDAGLDATIDAPICAPPFASGDCRGTSDCTSAMTCRAPGEPPACGTCVPPIATCVTSADCTAPDVCVFFTPPCSCGGPASECRPSCVTAGCPADEMCDGETGACVPRSCTSGYTCPSHTTCMESKSQDEHGCVRDNCSTDADCGCGACVEGLCYDDFGTCEFLPD